MDITKKVQLEGSHTVWAYVYRDGEEIAFARFSYIFTGCFLKMREHKAMRKAYIKANTWADGIVGEERKADHVG